MIEAVHYKNDSEKSL